ncbi:MAG: D-alanine--D-alanine ligase [Gammaproteobacteria bacterium]|nr:D-alanine--D-alanine ligase [Gammaproteobacteria bacterium]
MKDNHVTGGLAVAWQDLLTVPTGRIGVIYGGDSAEREISLMSGQQVLQHLLSAGVDAFGVDLASPQAQAQGLSQLQQLQQASMDAAFIAMHGPGGEDGTLQGVLEYLGVPYTGSGVMASSLGMHKLMTKMVWQSANISTPAWQVLHDHSDFQAVAQKLGLPLVVKPVHEGSSLGVNIVSTIEAMQAAYADAKAFDRQVMAEQLIVGEEYTVAILNDRALPAIRLQTDNEFYDLQAKYYSSDTRYSFDNALSAEQQTAMEAECVRAFAALECGDWGRIDVMRDVQGQDWLLEVNTSPGMTSHSLVPMAAQQAGLSYEQLVVVILNLCIQRQTKKGHKNDSLA